MGLVALNLNIDAEDFAKRFWAMFHPSQYISVSVSALYAWQTVVSMDAANGMIIMTVVGFCLGIAAQRLWDSCASKKAEECTAHDSDPACVCKQIGVETLAARTHRRSGNHPFIHALWLLARRVHCIAVLRQMQT